MEQTATPEGQGVGFDSTGELKFSEAGFDAFKDLLKDSVHDEPRPTEEALAEPEETESPEEVVEEPPKPVKKKIKVDGQELELSEDELIATAQKGMDYTRKMQALAAERDALAPYQALVTQLQKDPGLSQHMAKYWQPQAPQKPKFEDPIEELKWETKQEAIAEMRAEMQQALNQAVTPLHRQAALDQVKQQVQQDPDYQEVHQSIVQMVAAMPPSIQKNMYLQLDQDPASYLEAFQLQKARLMAARRTQPAAQPGETVKRTERAPILESSNSAPSESTVKAQRAKIDKAKANALRSGSVEALQGFLEAGGFLDHLK